MNNNNKIYIVKRITILLICTIQHIYYTIYILRYTYCTITYITTI